MHVRALSLVLLFAVPMAFADQVVLTNGDTITGKVVKMESGKLTFKSDILGEISMAWDSVKSLQSSENLTAVLPGGRTVTGPVRSSGSRVEITAPSGTQATSFAEVDTLRNPAEQQAWERLQHPGFLQLWSGFFDIGLALARGNARTDTLTTSFNATRTTRNDMIKAQFNQIYGTARIGGVSGTVANALFGGWSYNRDVSPRLFLNLLNDYTHDEFLDLDLRFVLGGGVGVNAIKTDTTNLSLIAGADYNRENFISNFSRNSAEAYFGDDLIWKASDVTTITQSSRVFPNVTETGEYRFNFNLSGVSNLNKWLGWHLTFTDYFLSNPLFGRQRNDMLLSTGLRLSLKR